MMIDPNLSPASDEETRFETQLLLGLLRPAGGADLDWPATAQWDWRSFARACDYHDVAPFIYFRLRGLADGGVPPGLMEHVRLRYLEGSGRNYHLAQKLVDLTSLLEEQQIPVLAYKGPTLALAAYGNLALRSYSDLDVVVRPEHLQKALGAMVRCGFEITPSWWNPCRPEKPGYLERNHEIPLRAPDKSYFVDLHWQLAAYEIRAFRLDVEQVCSRAERIELLLTGISTLCREDLFLALCCHGTWHRWVRLKWLLDVAELLQNAERLNWSRVEATVGGRQPVRDSASLAVLLARELLGTEVPAEAMRVLPATERTRKMAAAIRNEILLRGHTSGPTAMLGLEGSTLAWMKHWGMQSAWVFHQVFVQIGPKERAFVPLPERLEFLYHFIRPARLAIKHGRRLARTIWSMAAF